MADNTFDVSGIPRPEEDVTYNIGVDTDPVLKDAAVLNRSFQYHMSLGDNSPGAEQIMSDLKNGKEDQYQTMLQAQEMASRTAAAKDLIQKNIDNPNVSPEQVAALADLGNPPAKETVLEETWSKKAQDMLYAADDKSAVQKAIAESPIGLDERLAPFEKGIWKDRIAQKWKAKVDAIVSNTSWIPWVGYQGAQLVQVPTWMNIIGNWKDAPKSTSWLTAEALQQKVEAVRALEPEDMDQAIKAEVNALAATNPLDARKFVEALVSYSAADYDFNIVDDLSMVPVGTITKAGKAVKATKVFKTAAEAADAAKAIRASGVAGEAGKAATDAPKAVKTWDNITPEDFKDGKTITLYRGIGNNMGKPGDTAFFTTNPAKAAGYGEVHSIEVTQDEMKHFVKGHGGPDEFVTSNQDIIGRVQKANLKDPVQSEIEATARAVGAGHIGIPEALSGTGKPKAAVDYALRENLARRIAGPDAPLAQVEELAKNLSRTPSAFSPTVRVNAGDEFYKSALVDDEAVIKNLQDNLIKITELNRLTRKPEELLPKLFEEKEKVMRAYFSRGVQDNILHVENLHSNFLNVEIQKYAIGKSRTELFDSAKEAQRYAAANGIKNAKYKMSAGKWHIEAYAYVGEDRIAKSILTTDNQIPDDAWYQIRGHLGSIMQNATFQNIQRMRAVNGANKLADIIEEMYKPLSVLSKDEKNAVNEMMKINQLTEKIPGDPTTRGAFFHGIGELEDAYLRRFKRRPNPREVVAYNTMVRNSDLMYQFMTWGEARNKIIKGHETIEVPRMVEGGGIARSTFEGRVLTTEEFPIRDRGPNVDALVIDERGIVKRYNLSKLSEEDRTLLNRLVKEDGFTAVQTYKPDHPVLKKLGASDAPTAFVVSKDYRRSPIRLDAQVSYRPGFSNEYKDGFYIKAPKVRDGRYEGDTAFFRVRSEKQAQKLGSLLQKAKDLFDEGKLEEFKKFVDEKNMPFDHVKLGEIFTERFEKGVPLAVVRSGTKASETRLLNGNSFAEQFGDNISTELDDFYNPSASFGNPFVNKRDPLLYGVDELQGTEDNPIWHLTEADMVDPMLTQTKAMGNLIKSEFYNDYQWTAANHWIEEFLPNLMYDGKMVTPEQARRNPLYYLKNGTVVGDARRVAQAAQLKNGIVSLVGEPSWLAGQIDGWMQKLVDGVYEKWGQKATEYVPDQALPFVTNPDTYLRTVSFRTKMSFFNPVQFWKQAASAMNTIAAHPAHGMKAIPANFGFTLAYYTEDVGIIAKIDDVVSKASLGAWKPGEFTQSLKAFREAGFDAVSGTGFKGTVGDPKVVYNGRWSKFLHAGDFFFNQGELINRYASWNTAWAKHVAENPGKLGKMTRYDVDKIHKYGQTLSGNMSRDANAWWQNDSRTTLFTQFQAYPMRMIETMFGREMDSWAKVRLGLGHGMLWGIPVFAGGHYIAQNGGWDFWNKHMYTDAAERGINLDKTAIDLEYRGMVSVFTEWLTGEKLDFSSYGVNVPFAQTAQNFDRVYKTDGFLPALVSTLIGASGSIGNNILREGGYVSRDLIDLVTRQGVYSEVLPDDLVSLAKEISAVNVWERVLMAGNAAAYRNRNGAEMSSGENPLADFTKAMLGVENMDKAFAFNALEDAKRIQQLKEKSKDYIKRSAIKMWEAEQRDDWDESRRYAKYINAAGIAGGLSEEEVRSLIYLDGDKAGLMEEVILKGITKKMKAGSDEKANFEQELERRFSN